VNIYINFTAGHWSMMIRTELGYLRYISDRRL